MHLFVASIEFHAACFRCINIFPYEAKLPNRVSRLTRGIY